MFESTSFKILDNRKENVKNPEKKRIFLVNISELCSETGEL